MTEETTAAGAPVPAPMPATEQPVNPLLDRGRLPGETFPLPSGGLFYKGNELHESVTDAEVHVHPMVALDEIMMKTPDMLFSGDAVRKIFQRCIPQIEQPGQLLARDVDYLLVALRKVSYGEEMEITYQHDCKDAKSHSYVVNVNDFLQKTKRIDPTTMSSTFVVQLSNQMKVHIQPIRFDDMVKVIQTSDTNEDKMDPEKIKNMLLDGLANVIIQVDEITKPDWIRQWLETCSPKELGEINRGVDNSIKWGPDFVSTIKCKDCDKMVEAVIPLNPLAFFT